ncbi:MAG: sucrase ferredoxin [Pseudomonadales bacterium]
MANSSSATGTGSGARTYCSEQNPEEPLWGTADTVDVWLCLEYRPAWKARALTDNALAAPTRQWLEQTVAALAGIGLKARPQFVRQPRIDREDVRLLVTSAGRTARFSGRGYDFLLDLDLPAQLGGGTDFGAGGEMVVEPQYLVCTNGQRDLCCARYGLPIYTELAERVGERAWQVTHLGGHRFAANVLTLPDACLYGRITPETLSDFVSKVEAGEPDFPHLRGRTCYPPIVQAAEAALGRQEVRLLHVDGDEDAGTVVFADAHQRWTVPIRRAESAMKVMKSCGDEAELVHPFVRG